MSSKLLRTPGPGAAVPIVWESTAAPAPIARPPAEATPPAPEPALSAEAVARQLEQQLEEAYRRGVAEGRQSAGETAAREQAQWQERFAAAAATFAATRSRLRHQAEGDVVKLALAIGRRILKRELAVDPQSLQTLVRIALERLDLAEVSRIRVHTAHLAAVRAELARTPRTAVIETLADPTLEPGDLLIDAAGAELDASIESQLKEIELGFADRLGH